MRIIKNEDKEWVEIIEQRLKDNLGFCPCKIDKTPENRCICKEFLESTETGLCHCGRYRKIEV